MSRNSKPLQTKPPTTSGHGDADAALNVARILRDEGFLVGSVRVGDVEIGLAVMTNPGIPAAMLGAPGQADALATSKSIYEEWGGPDFAKHLNATQPDIVDDDDQPAVRS